MQTPFYVQVTDPRTDETLLSRQITKEEWEADKSPLDFASEALDHMIELDPEEADYPNCSDVEVTFYERKRDIGGPVCFSNHGFYAAQ